MLLYPHLSAVQRTKTLVCFSCLSLDGDVTSILPATKRSPLQLPAIMPSSGFTAAGDIGVPSRSAIVGAMATGHHLLDIEGYSLTKELVPTGDCVYSIPLSSSAGGSTWRICYYPNGDHPDAVSFISVCLELYDVDSAVDSVTAQTRFSPAGSGRGTGAVAQPDHPDTQFLHKKKLGHESNWL